MQLGTKNFTFDPAFRKHVHAAENEFDACRKLIGGAWLGYVVEAINFLLIYAIKYRLKDQKRNVALFQVVK